MRLPSSRYSSFWDVSALLAAVIACVLTAPTFAQSGQASADRPNIVFIFSDDHAVQALGAYGGRLAHLNPTPEIDRLAEEGMVFRNAFVTNSICAPSRATILSGQHSHMNGVRTNQTSDSLAESVTTFPELLQDAGYQTAMIGKWHLKSEPQGFDYWEVLPGQGVYYNPTFRRPSDTTQYTGYVSEIITDRAIRWLQEGQNEDEPFLLMYQHKAPHRNWQPGPEHLTTYDDVTVPAPRSLFYDYSGLSSPATMQEMEIANDLSWGWDLKLNIRPGTSSDSTYWARRMVNRFTPEQRKAWMDAYGPTNKNFHEAYRDGDLQGRDLTRWKYQRYIKDYLRSIRSMDDQIGRLLNELDRLGVAEETIVVYASDQGFFLGEKGWFDKRWMYEESFRMPLLVRWPGVVEPSSESSALVQNLDIAQTFLDAAGVKAPDAMQGRSLSPLLRGKTPDDWRDALYYHYYEYPAVHSVMRHEGVRTDRYKLIHHYWANQWSLFDLQTDPHELNNVYGHPDYAEVTKRLKRKLRQLKTRYQVPDSVTQAGPGR
ncbi:MAG: sulfatase [Salinibacter sp.]|uniref:sulfatase n=1 Tax=Salinibacter sp. TaxID=2065818 RepID=UPI0035D47FBD